MSAFSAFYFTDRLKKGLQSIATKPLTLVRAPMGYGKTVAVREYARAQGVRTLWVAVLGGGASLGASPGAEAEENTFWRELCQALATAFPAHGHTVESLARLGYPRDSVLVGAAYDLLRQLDFGPQTLLVVDDIHLLPSRPAGGGMVALCQLLARQAVAHLCLVLISRDADPLTGTGSRESLALKGHMAVIDREALALDAHEIRHYYGLCGLDITPQTAAALHAATGGWISALYLCLLHYGKDGSPPLPQYSAGFKTPQSVDALLEEEIFSPLPAQVRDMLLALSPLERFSAAQAVFLLQAEQDNVAVTDALASLLQRNCFIALDAESGLYTLHSLFRQALCQRFEQLSAARRQTLHSRCADWFVQCGDVVAAMKACHAAGDYERALSVLESDMSRNFVTENARYFVELFRACPEDILARHMGAAFKYAIAAFSSGDYATFGAQLAWIGKRCAERMAQCGEDDPEAKAWGGELQFLLSLAAYNDIAAMSAHHRRANALLGRATQLFGPESPWTLGCPSVLFMFHRTSGKLDEELQLMDACLPHYYALASMHGAGGELQMRAEALLYRGDFKGAAVACHKAQAMAASHGQLSVVLCALFVRLRLALYAHNTEAARAVLAEMREQIGERRNFFLLHTVDLCEGYLHAFTGQSQGIPPWLRKGLGEEKRLYTFANGYYYVVHGRALLLDKEYAAVGGLFAWLLQAGAFAKHALFTVYAHVYMAAAHTALGLKKEATASLCAALDVALPDSLYLPLAENADFLPQLKTLSRKRAYGAGVRQILRLAFSIRADGDKGQGRSSAKAEMHGAWIVLTARERQLVQLALKDKTYADIAVGLGIAQSTVKRAFGSIFKKLGVHSRHELAALFHI